MKLSKKIMLFSGAVAVCASALAAVSYALTSKMVKIALDREKPNSSEKSASRLSGTSLNEFSEQIEQATQKLENSKIESVELIAGDGERLVGHLYKNNNAKRIIVAMHGWRSSWSRDFGPISDFWKYNNCTILYADQRGHNESGGEYIGFGLVERHDCVDWVDWINENINPDGLPIYLAGISMGATTVLMASGLNLAENVCGIMADCGFTSPHAIWKHVANNNLRISYGIVSAMANSMYRKRIDMNTDEYSTVEALKETTIPILLIHGSDDRFVLVEMNYENYKACRSPKKLLIFPGAQHAMSYYVNKAEYEDIVKRFWKEFDKNNMF